MHAPTAGGCKILTGAAHFCCWYVQNIVILVNTLQFEINLFYFNFFNYDFENYEIGLKRILRFNY